MAIAFPVGVRRCAAERRARTLRRQASDPSLRRVMQQLIAARVRAGLTQQQVAVKLATKKSAISRLESGASHRPTLATSAAGWRSGYCRSPRKGRGRSEQAHVRARTHEAVKREADR